MKKSLLFALLCSFVLVGCEDKNGVDYSDYPIAGKSYKTELIDGTDYDIISFNNNGSGIYEAVWSEGKSNKRIYWTMEGNRIDVYYNAKHTDFLDYFIYHDTYLVRGENTVGEHTFGLTFYKVD